MTKHKHIGMSPLKHERHARIRSQVRYWYEYFITNIFACYYCGKDNIFFQIIDL